MHWNNSEAALLHWPVCMRSPVATMQFSIVVSCAPHRLSGGSYEQKNRMSENPSKKVERESTHFCEDEL